MVRCGEEMGNWHVYDGRAIIFFYIHRKRVSSFMSATEPIKDVTDWCCLQYCFHIHNSYTNPTEILDQGRLSATDITCLSGHESKLP